MLNGVATEALALPDALAPLMDSAADTVALRPSDGTDVQRLLDVIALLRDAGLANLAILEPAS